MRKLTLTLGLGWLWALLLSITFTSQTLHGQCDSGTISGTVYYDANVDGLIDGEVGIANSLVTIYDRDGNIAGQTISGNDGVYEVTGLSDDVPYRVQFDYSTQYVVSGLGQDNGSEVQFATSPECGVNFGLTDVVKVCDANPDIILTCFVRSGLPENELLPTVIGLEHDFSGVSTVEAYATQAETGAVWGIHSKQSTSEIFLASFVKQYSHLKDGHDAIYKVSEVNGSYQTSLFTQLSALGQTVGALSNTDPFDCAYGEQVGRIGLGSLTMSSDEKDMYVVNIHNNTLVKLSSTTPTQATTVSYNIPNPACSDGEYYAFALTQYNDKIYVGVTCTAETSQDVNDSAVTVYEFDPVTTVFTNIFSSNASLGFWKDNPSDTYHRAHWLTDIAFTDDGNMVLALSDRLGHRYCDDHKGRLDDQKGDLWFVAKVNGTWTLESNGQAGTYTGTGIGNGEGPGGGEFFGQDNWLTDPAYHNETTLGSVLIVEGSNEVVSAVFDPITNSYSGGLHRYSTRDGSLAAAIELYSRNPNELFGKATGFGGITSKCGPAGIEVGNLVWIDDNANGAQDPGEFSVSGLRLDIYDDQCNLVGSTLTDESGNYTFSSNSFIDADGITREGLKYNSKYYVAVGADRYDATTESYTINNKKYFATVSNTNDNSVNSDLTSEHPNCADLDGIPVVEICTEDAGQNDYTFDIGFRAPSNFDLALTKTLVSNKFVKIGEVAKFVITVVNQGELASSEVTIADYIPSGYSFDGDLNPDWRYEDDIAKYKINTPILPGGSYDVELNLGVRKAAFEEYLNFAEISGAIDENNDIANDSDSTADEDPNNDTGGVLGAASDDQLSGNGIDDEDDHDVAGVTVVDLALRKEVVGSANIVEGNLVRFNITVYNQGTIPTTGFTIIDYLPQELFFDYSNNSGWTAGNDGLYYNYDQELVPGDSHTIPLFVTVKSGLDNGDIYNYSEIMSFSVADQGNNVLVDFDSTPDNTEDNDSGASIPDGTDNEISDSEGFDEDDHDVAKLSLECFDLALKMTSDEKLGEEGKEYKYIITVENQGSIPAGSVTLSDYIPAGMTLADDTWTALTDDEASKTITFPGGLQPGTSHEECITLMLEQKQETMFMVNYAEISYATNLEGVDFSNLDKDSKADRLKSNDAGGEALSENDNRLSGNGIDDEDDHDPEPIYFVEVVIADPCLCLNNATTSTDGQFSEEVTINGPSGQIWTIDFVEGLYDDIASAAPPAAPTPFVTGPTGVVFAETPNGDGTSVYNLLGIHIDELGYSIRVTNQDGVFLQYVTPPCFYDDALISGDASEGISTAVCVGSDLVYEVEDDPACTYLWTLSGGGTITTPIDEPSIGVTWGTDGSHTLSVTKTCPTGCIAPGELTVEVGTMAGVLACAHDLNISVDDGCCITVTPDMLMAVAPTVMASYGVVLMDQAGNILPGNEVCSEFLGETIMAQVVDGCSGNSCWSNITIEDKTAPTVQCSDIDVPCFMVESYMPFAFDNCTDAEISIVNETVTPLTCDPNYIKEIERTYVAVDGYGNTSLECTQVISVTRFPSADVVFPAGFEVANGTELACSDIIYNSDGFPDYALTGVPTLYGTPIFPTFTHYCNIAIAYEDLLINDSDCVKKYMRTWTFYEDWCSLGVLLTATQVIEIADMEDPILACPADTIVYSDGAQCATDFTFVLPQMSDDCSSDLELDIAYPNGFLDDYTSGSVVLEAGQNIISYTVYDGCQNSSTCEFTVTVVDNTPPVAICDQNTVVSLRSDGTAYAPASVFDDGSYDDCGLKKILVQRMGDFDCPCETPDFTDMNYLGEYDGHHYYAYVGTTDAFLASAYADAYGGYLAVINDENEASWLTGVVGQDYYVGLNDAQTEGTYVWNNGGTVSYTNWAASNPTGTGDNVYVSGADGQWRDIDGLALELTYVMELDDPCSWSEHVNFCCSDAGAEHMVAMRVIDQFGYTNNCMVNVEVQDKVSPIVSCPANLTISCLQDIDLNDLSSFGEATATDVCGVTLEHSFESNMDQCGKGTITRTFTASDATSSSVCVQVITIENDDLLTEADITWPEDLTLNSGCSTQDLNPSLLEAQYGYPVINSTSCDMAAATYDDEYFAFDAEGACSKILRKWSVINWCEIDDPDYESFTYYQVFKINDITNPEITVSAVDETICSFDPDCGGTVVSIQATATDDCNPDNLGIRYEIDLFSNGVVDMQGNLIGNSIDLTDDYPLGQHSIVITFEDMCGNQDGEAIVFEVVNCKTPIAYCINGLSIGLQPMDTDGDGQPDNEMACLFAENVDAGSSHPCGNDVTVAFSEDVTDTKLTFDCFDLGIQTVTLYVIDEFGNFDFCTTTVEVQDNNDFDFCEDPKDCITFGPDDLEVTECIVDLDPSIIGGAPTVEEDCACDDYTITYSDVMVSYPNATCSNLIRTHTVTFLCGDIPLVCDHVQNIVVRNTIAPTITCPDDIVLEMGAMTAECEAFIAIPTPVVSDDGCSSGVVVTHTTSTGGSGGLDASGVYEVGVTVVTYTVTDACGNSSNCSFSITVPDDEAPQCNVQDITVTVDASGNVVVTGDQLDNGTVDNCGDLSDDIIVSPNTFTCSDIGDNVVTVTVSDTSGNTSSCTATVTVVDETGPNCNLMPATLSVTAGGTVTVDIADINDGSADPCGSIASFDIVPNTFDCSNVGSNTVTVTVTDNSGNSTTCTTTVTITDMVAPICNVDDITINASSASPIIVTPADLNIASSDACGSIVSEVVSPNAFDCDDLGSNTVTVTVTDNSGNTSTCMATVTVEDNNMPECVVQDITVTLDVNGEVSISPVDIDAGSNAGCGGDLMYDITPDEFFCNDVGSQTVSVIVSVSNGNTSSCEAIVTVVDSTDPTIACPADVTASSISDLSDLSIFGIVSADDNCAFQIDSTIVVNLDECNVGEIVRTYTATDNVGNTATCAQTITLLDDSPILVTCPADVTIDCSSDLSDLSLYGVISVVDDCPFEIDSTIIIGLNECNLGLITRSYTVTDVNGVVTTCQQVIEVSENQTVLQLSDIVFPQDVTVSDCSLISPDDLAEGFDFPIVNTSNLCGGATITFVDLDVVSQNDDVCLDTIRRKWTIVDDCQFSLNGGGMFMDTQLVVIDEVINPFLVIPSFPDTVLTSTTNCNADITLVVEAGDSCSGVVSFTNDSEFAESNEGGDLSGNYPVGDYNIQLTVTDACGNTAIDSIQFVVDPLENMNFNCQKIIVQVDAGVQTMILASQIAPLAYFCSDTEYEYFFLGGDPIFGDDPDFSVNIPFFTVNCNDAPSVQGVYVGVYENGTLIDFCDGFFEVADADGDCGNQFDGDIYGKVTTEMGDEVQDVKVDLAGDMSTYVMSNQSGEYNFDDLSYGGSYRVEPFKDGDDRNGVSTADIILIQRHLLGIQNLNSPYKHIAADVNASGTITASDISQIRKLILEHYTEFPDNTSWRMIENSFDFIPGINPLLQNFPEEKDIYNLSDNMGIYFTGVKVGDVNNSALPSVDAVSTEYRSESAYIHLNNLKLEQGIHTIEFPIVTNEDFVGFQLKLNTTSAEILSVTSDLDNFSHNNYSVTGKEVVVSYNTLDDSALDKASLTLELEVFTDGLEIQDVIDLDQNWVNEVYGLDHTDNLLMQVVDDNSEELVLYQNSPNPWSDETAITFYSKNIGESTISIHDLSGKSIYSQSIVAKSGMNRVMVSKQEIPVSGVLYYQVSNDNARVQGKMILIN